MNTHLCAICQKQVDANQRIRGITVARWVRFNPEPESSEWQWPRSESSEWNSKQCQLLKVCALCLYGRWDSMSRSFDEEIHHETKHSHEEWHTRVADMIIANLVKIREEEMDLESSMFQVGEPIRPEYTDEDGDGGDAPMET